MEVPKNLIDVLLYFVPALLIIGAVYLLIKKFLDRDYKLKLIEAKQGLQKDVLPLRLQAYERIILFLERITPASLLIRLSQPNMTSGQLHHELLNSIRTEFDHNITQQIYISSPAWEQAKIAKEEIVRIINIAYDATGPNNTAIKLSTEIFEVMLRNENLPSQKAIDFIKTEVRQITMQH